MQVTPWTVGPRSAQRRGECEFGEDRQVKVREGGVVTSQAVPIAVGIDLELAAPDPGRHGQPRERLPWKDFLLALRRRGLGGVEFVVADDHAGLRSAIREVLLEAAVQRMLRALPPKRLGPSSAQGRRRLPAGVAPARRPAKRRGGPPRPGRTVARPSNRLGRRRQPQCDAARVLLTLEREWIDRRRFRSRQRGADGRLSIH